MRNPRFKYRRVLIIPAGDRSTVNASLEAMGYGADNFSIPMIGKNADDGADPTHYACDIQMDDTMRDDFLGVIATVNGEEKDVGNIDAKDRFKKIKDDKSIRVKPYKNRTKS